MLNTKQYTIRKISEKSEIPKIKELFNNVFKKENVGTLAEVATDSMPGLSYHNWYVAESDIDKELVAGLAQISWDITFKNIKLKVWEQAIVGTLEKHRGKGLLTGLNKKLDENALAENVDMIIIQGIPGFYDKFGYRYSIEFENHINMQLELIEEDNKSYVEFRNALKKDIPFFIEQEKIRDDLYTIQSRRSADNWCYLMTDAKETEYSCDIWIFDYKNYSYFVKVQKEGFGEGLIVSEISENLPEILWSSLLSFLKEVAVKRGKPYIRFDLPAAGSAAKKLVESGAELTGDYGWQVKIVNPLSFLTKIKTVLEKRLSISSSADFSGIFSFWAHRKRINLHITKSVINQITIGNCDSDLEVMIPEDLFEPLVLGFHSWKELRICRPDLYSYSKEAEVLSNTLFPKEMSWLYSIW